MADSDINKKTVLIADDDTKNRKLFRVALQSYGYKTIEAEDGKQCVKLAKETLPDLILMDIQMPVMDGITALKTLIADPATSKIPVIAVTSYAMKGDRERFLAKGFVDYIPKPIDIKKFKEVIGKYI
ncbi:MAG: response regulator [Nitrospirae bacterium]|nr:response regulator [Nitrospirota bacterium]